MTVAGIFRDKIKTLNEKKNNQKFIDDETGVIIKPRSKRASHNLPDTRSDLYVSNGRSWKDKSKRGRQYKNRDR